MTRFACGHIGFTTGRKVKGFIRVAELRGKVPEKSRKQCPDCVKADQ